MPKSRRQKRRHPNWPVRALLVGAGIGLSLWLWIPVWRRHHELQAMELDAAWGQLLAAQFAEILGVGWFAFLGASLGSFMNVVVWRLPRGKSLFGRSYCPWCAVKIKSYDNLPILGWLILRGRCRACHLPISPRYPLVELLMCVLFVLLFFAEVWSGGASVPGEALTNRRGVLELVFTPHRELLGLYFFHGWLVFHLVAWSLIHWDGLVAPRGYGLVCLVAPLVLGWIFEWLHPVPLLAGPLEALSARWPHANQVWTGPIGLAMGVLLGNEFDVARPRQSPQAVWFLGLVGVQLGWQAALSVALVATVLPLLCGIWGQAMDWTVNAWPLGGWIALGAVAQLLLWKVVAEHVDWWPGPSTSVELMAICCLGVVMGQLALGRQASS